MPQRDRVFSASVLHNSHVDAKSRFLTGRRSVCAQAPGKASMIIGSFCWLAREFVPLQGKSASSNCALNACLPFAFVDSSKVPPVLQAKGLLKYSLALLLLALTAACIFTGKWSGCHEMCAHGFLDVVACLPLAILQRTYAL